MTEDGGNGMAEECKGMGCKWWEDQYVCTASDETPACELYYAEPPDTQCPSQCEYNKDVEKCLEKGATPPCDLYYDETACKASGKCQFNADIYKCWDIGGNIPCIEFEYYEQDKCPQYCNWVETNQKYGESGTCLDKDAVAACEVYSNSEDGSTCPKDRCEWHVNEAVCWGKDRELPCSYLKGEMCAPAGRCQWYETGSYGEGSCGDCSTGEDGCVSKWTPPDHGNDGYENDAYDHGYNAKPDNGNKCNTFADDSVYDCPEPRCYLDWDPSGTGSGDNNGLSCEGGTTNGNEICRDSECADFRSEEDSCKGHTGCTYDDESGICSDPSKPYPCKAAYEVEECSKHSDVCAWKGLMDGDDDEGFCYDKAATIPCGRFDQATFCPTATCKWMKGTYSCVDKDYEPQCSEFGAEGDCPASDGCTWTNGICWEEGKDIPCAAFCTAYECNDSGACQFDSSNWKCIECEGGSCPKIGACSSYTTSDTCPESKCEFAYDESEDYSADRSGTCQDKVCVGIYNKDECDGSGDGCEWHAGGGDYANAGNCFKKGYSMPCNKIWEKTDCSNNACDWDADNGRCSEKGSTGGCHIFSEDECPTSTCEWNEDMYECVVKSSLEPNTPPPLTGKGDGTGNEDTSKCTPSMFNQVKGKLEQAEDECIVVGRHNRHSRAADDQQLECLAYFLAQSPNPTTVKDSCPCLWFFAKEVSPWEDHWMQIAC